MFNTPNTTKNANNDSNDQQIAPPIGFHYWGTEPILSSEGNPSIPLRPKSSLSRSQEYIDLYCKTTDQKVWLCCVPDCKNRVVKMATELLKSGEVKANFYNFFIHLQRHHIHFYILEST